jgi:hypothetical protein
MRKASLDQISRALALGLPRREILRRTASWIGASILAVALPSRTSAESGQTKSGLTAGPGPGFTAMDSIAPPVSVNGTVLNSTVITSTAVNGTVLNATTLPTTLNGTPLPGSGTSQVAVCDLLYCYTAQTNPTGTSQDPAGVPFQPPASLGPLRVQVNGTSTVIPRGWTFCDSSYCYAQEPDGSIHVISTGYSPAPPDAPLGPELGRFCDSAFCYSIHRNNGSGIQLNGTSVLVNGTTITPVLINGTAVKINGSLPLPIQVNGSSVGP